MGDNREREMVQVLDDRGWGALRLGSSGGGTARSLPDILAGDGGDNYLALEEKYRGQSLQCYIEPEEATALNEFCAKFGARPLYAMRYSTRLDGVETADWFVAPAHVPPTTPSGKVKLHHSIVSEWPTLTELLDTIDEI